jgi:uncharacterized protein (TIGR02147 family)
MATTKQTAGHNSADTGTRVPLPDLFAYLDYRKFLRDFCAAKQQQNPHYSYRYLSTKAGIKSGGFFSWVLQGKRNLSPRIVFDLARMFGFTRPQTAYFEQLVAFNQATTHEERKIAFDKLLSMRRGTVHQVREEQVAFYSTWYHAALRELISIIPVRDDTIAEAAAQLTPAIKSSDAAKSLALLVQLGMARKNDAGIYERTDEVLSSKEHVPLVALHDYQIGSMELAKAALDQFGANERELSTVTMSIDNDAYLKIIERLAMFRAEVMEIARSVKKPSRVMQLNLHYFPLSRQNNEGRHE